VKVLVVDDDPDQLPLRCLLLDRNGFNTLPASDAGSAIDLATRERPDYAILDLRLPDEKTGVQLVCDLKRILPDLRIILFTGASAAQLSKYPELRLLDDVVQKSAGSAALIGKLKAGVKPRSTSKP
jgi:two-component system response regulator RegA